MTRTPWRAPRPTACALLVCAVDNAAQVWEWMRDLDRPAHLDEVLARCSLPRWRLLLVLRAHPEAFDELMGARWRAKKQQPKA